MFKKITLDNFKSFDHIEFDLTGDYNKPKKCAFVYGENGAGKSNLISAFLFLRESISTLESFKKLNLLKEKIKFNSNDNTEINANKLTPDEMANFLTSMIRNPNSLSTLANTYRMIDSDEGIKVCFEICLDETNGHYELFFDEHNNLIHEKLFYLINNRAGTVFEINANSKNEKSGINVKFSSSLFNDNNYKKQVEDLVEQYWGKHTLVAILVDQRMQNNYKFMKSRINNNVFTVIDFFNLFTVCCDSDESSRVAYAGVSNKMLVSLLKGHVEKKDKKAIQVFEEALNDFFTRTYSDIKRVYYNLKKEKNGLIRYELFFTKQIGGKVRDINARYESTGTLKLLDNFPAFYECAIGHTVVLDEIDSGVHDLLMSNILNDLIKAFKGQFITTTHNTLLLKSIDPDSAYIIQVDSCGNKIMQTIKDMGITQKNHNNQDRYLSGLFDGVPNITSIDFADIVSRVHLSLGDNDEQEV